MSLKETLPYSTEVGGATALCGSDLFLFYNSSTDPLRTSPRDLTVIGGRCCRGKITPGRSLFGASDIPEREAALISRAIRGATPPAVLFPWGDKIMMIYNRLLRASGTGLALIFDSDPRAGALLAGSGELSHILFSDSFSALPVCEKSSAELAGTLIPFLRTAEKVCASDIFCAVTESASLMGCRAVCDMKASEDSPDCKLLATFFLCLFSFARRMAAERSVSVSLMSGERTLIRFVFTAADGADFIGDLSELSYCDFMARRLSLPFSFVKEDELCFAEFIPSPTDPAGCGFKAGIFIDGRPLLSPYNDTVSFCLI